MPYLKDILAGDIPENLSELPITDVSADSRNIQAGGLFFAIRGSRADGLHYAQDAIEKGARAIVVAQDVDIPNSIEVPVIRSEDIRRDYSFACARFHEEPSTKIHCIGVTGTNGKTSVSWILSHALTHLGKRSALCGTLGKKVPVIKTGNFEPLANTSPDPKIIHSFLVEAIESDCASAVLEVTSQGVVHHRTSAVEWDAGVFTNLTRDHLDVHGDMASYAQAKRRFFTHELAASPNKNKIAVLNIDDPTGLKFFHYLSEHYKDIHCLTCSITKAASGQAREIFSSIAETRFAAILLGDKVTIQSRLIGAFNVENLLASATCLRGLGYSGAEIADALREVPPVPGRLEVISTPTFHAVIDYAHTPDGLIQAQRSLRPLTRKRLITVFGCGGDRDKGKRPMMGEAVAELSDMGILTSDNPRTEDPDSIIDDILPGVERGRLKNAHFTFQRITERQEAITWALHEADSGDVVLIAGKGHEDYQEIGHKRIEFSDVAVCLKIIGNQKG